MNHKSDHIQICGYRPHRFPPQGRLTPEQKEYNKKLSEMRVVVENSIGRVKTWKILKGPYWHWRCGKGQINANNVLTVVVALLNCEIKKSSPHKARYAASDQKQEQEKEHASME